MPSEPAPLEFPARVSRPHGGGLRALIGALLGMVLVIAVLHWQGPLPKTTTPHPWPATLAAIVGVALAPLVHELGHVAGGILAGMRFVWLVWGPFEVRRVDGRVRLSWNRRPSLAGGMALCLPTTVGDSPRRTIALYAGGGPLISFVTGAAGLWLASVLGMPAIGTVSGWAMAGFGLASIGIGLVTSIPQRRGDVMSDGARLLHGLGGEARARRELARAALGGLSLGPDRPRDWPASLIAEACGDDADFGPTLGFLLYAHALDSDRTEQAQAFLQKALSAVDGSGAQATELALEAAFFELAIRGDVERSRTWLARAGRSLDRLFLQAVQAAIAIHTGSSQASILQTLAEKLAKRSGLDGVRADRLLALVDPSGTPRIDRAGMS